MSEFAILDEIGHNCFYGLQTHLRSVYYFEKAHGAKLERIR